MNLKELYRNCVTQEKQQADRLIPWHYYLVRPLSIVFTYPLLKTNITPTVVTSISMMAIIIGFFLVSFGACMIVRIIGWCCFFVWAVLDCVDGNLARFKGMASEKGMLWDATGGYMALSLIFFASGIGAYYDKNLWQICEPQFYIIFGGMASLMSLFPRLVMHKKKSTEFGKEAAIQVADKKEYNVPKIVALNIESAIGPMQLILLLAIIFHFMNLFALFYMLFNLLMMTYSLYLLLK